MASGISSRTGSGVGHGLIRVRTDASNLDDFIPHPVARRRRQGGSGALGSALPAEMEKPTLGVILGLIVVLVLACVYALQVSYRLTRLDTELTDPDAPLPPATVKLLERLAESRVADTLADSKMKIAVEMEKITKELLATTVHKKISEIEIEIQKRVEADLGESQGGAKEAEERPPAKVGWVDIPEDLKFRGTNMTEWIQWHVNAATKDMLPPRPKFYNGPADLEDAITKRAKEIDDEWKAKGSPTNLKPGIKVAYWEKHPPWPFQKLRDAYGREIGIIGVSAPMVDDYYQGELERGTFWRLKNLGHIMLGIASYEHFPGEILNPSDNRHIGHNPTDKNIYNAIEGWLHCQRDPEHQGLPPGVPRALISESDFTDPFRKDGGGVVIPEGIPKQYDFLYVNQGGSWNDYNRNYTMAKIGLRIMAEMGLKVVVLSRDVSNEPELAPYVKSGNLIVRKAEPWRDFLKLVESCRAVFTPCVSDASPRVAAEAMSKGTAVLMNWHIVGGWKYINDKTGVFFHDEHDIKQAIEKLRSPDFQKGLNPRQWFIDNWGPHNSGVRLQAFLEITLGKDRLAEARAMRTSHRRRLG